MEYVFISSWAHGARKGGIDQHTFDPDTGELKYIRTLDETDSLNTSFLNKDKSVLYALNETEALPPLKNGGGGRIFSYKLDNVTGDVVKLGETPTFCPNPAYLGIDPTGKFAVVANHASRGVVTKIEKDAAGKYHYVLVGDDAVVELFAINEDGSIGTLLDVVKHEGHGPGERQNIPHPHCAVLSPSGKFFAVCDKGNDTIYMYGIDKEAGKLFLSAPPFKVEPASMPRYSCFHPNQPFFYHNSEGNTSVSAYTYDENGNLTWIGNYNALPADYISKPGVCEGQGLCIHPNGKFIYAALNGPDCVSVFEIDQNTGSLTLIQNQKVGYAWTRGIALSPDGRFLIAACLKDGKVVVLVVGEDGMLSKTGFEYERNDAAFATFVTTR